MDTVKEDKSLEEIIALAAEWQNRANDLVTAEERTTQKRLRKLILHPLDKDFLTKLIDQCFRSNDAERTADQITYLLKRSAFPEFFSIWDLFLMWLFLTFGRHFPRFSVPLMMRKIRRDFSETVISADDDDLNLMLKKQKQDNIRLNLNHLGAAVLGKREAEIRLAKLKSDLENPNIEYISIRVDMLCPQIHTLAFDDILEDLTEKLSVLYRTAQANYYTYRNGIQVPKFINLDMEDYEYFELSVAAFQKCLDQLEFKNHTAGIVLQAYLPEAFQVQKELTRWAKNRVSSGGNPIKIRIVKGANLEMEKIHASLKGWPLATFDNKLDVDASFKRMVDYGLSENHYKAVQLGIASHNIFDLAYAYQKASEQNATDYIVFEMLFGMAGHIQRAIREISGDIILYTPVAFKDEFINAVSYLVRRLDENTSRDNFMRHAVGLSPGTEAWSILRTGFIKSCERKEDLSSVSNREQNRLEPLEDQKTGTYHLGKFCNEPSTDWSRPLNRTWAKRIRQKWMRSAGDKPVEIPLVIDGQSITDGRKVEEAMDPSQYPTSVVSSRYCMAQKSDIDHALRAAREDLDGWRRTTYNERHLILSNVAQNIREIRGDLIGATAATTGKTFVETDVEISQAIDFVEYYPHSVKSFIEFRNLKPEAKGVIVVITPWNSPVSTPCGGIAAALATGNTVVFKPSRKAVLPSWLICQCFWKAGVSQKTLQLVTGDGEEIGAMLATHQETNAVVFTGRTRTGLKLLQAKPDLSLTAETGAKNAIIVTAVSDKDQAIKNIVTSAFGNGGQMGSAASLLILEKEVFQDAQFKDRLIDATRAFKCGSAWDFKSMMGPLIKPPDGDLLKALTTLEEEEEWALKPVCSEENPCVWSPGIKWNVKPGSMMHKTELFGPILGVMKAENFDQAVEYVNDTGYGLSSGLESLDKRKQEYWKSKISAGNLYMNRYITGSSVLRQPFGGMGFSKLGLGIKTGGPNYVSQFFDYTESGSPAEIATQYDRRLLRMAKNWMKKTDRERFKDLQTDIQKTVRAMNSYIYHAKNEFRVEKDFFHLRGQDNIHRYLPVGKVVVRVHEEDSVFEILARIAAAQIARCKVLVSVPYNLRTKAIEFLEKRERRELLSRLKIVRQTDEELIALMPKIARIRYAAEERVPQSVLTAAAKSGLYIARDKVLMEGRLELLNYYKSQSVCHNYHRNGNLGPRSFDQSMNSGASS